MTDFETRLRRLAAAATAAEEAAADARTARNTAIREALDAGWRPSGIAKVTGLAYSTINQLIPKLYR